MTVAIHSNFGGDSAAGSRPHALRQSSHQQEGRRVEKSTKPVWMAPQIHRYGTFEQKTQGCDKMFGENDGFTFTGQPVVCAS